MRFTDLQVERVPWTELRPHPDNPRNGDTAAIAASLRTHGQFRPLVVARDLTIIAGNHTYAAAGELGMDEMDVVRLDIDPGSPQAHAIMLADNRTADLARYDEAALLTLLTDLDAAAWLEGTGYDADDVAHLREVLDALPPITDGDEDFDETLLWPVVRARLHPDLHERWKALPGRDDSDRLARLLGEA